MNDFFDLFLEGQARNADQRAFLDGGPLADQVFEGDNQIRDGKSGQVKLDINRVGPGNMEVSAQIRVDAVGEPFGGSFDFTKDDQLFCQCLTDVFFLFGTYRRPW